MKAVYYINNSRTWGHVTTQVWDILGEKGFLKENTGIILKGCYKDLVRRLGKEYQIPIFKHQRLRRPEELEWTV